MLTCAMSHFSARTPPALEFPNVTDDILRAVIAVCMTLLSLLVVDQWLMGGTITESLILGR